MTEKSWALSFVQNKEFREKFESAHIECSVEHSLELSKDEIPEDVLAVLRNEKMNYIIHELEGDEDDFSPKPSVKVSWDSKMTKFIVKIEDFKADTLNRNFGSKKVFFSKRGVDQSSIPCNFPLFDDLQKPGWSLLNPIKVSEDLVELEQVIFALIYDQSLNN
jgi:hypothetical protein